MADLLSRFLRGDILVICQTLTGELTVDAVRPAALLCGSFNPIHAGHLRLAQVASERLGVSTAFELGVVNADKKPLESQEVQNRLGQFTGLRDVWLTHQSTFLGKSALFPGTAFVVGQDTAARIADPRYYDGIDGLLTALSTLGERGCRFLVAGRADGTGQFRPADTIKVPNDYRHLFMDLPETEFRLDISSTMIRDRRI